MKRYEALAQEIAESIAHGRLRPGERVPSVREASRSRGVRPSTVFEAYYLLEARGLIEARPRSGYFVSHTVNWQQDVVRHRLAAVPRMRPRSPIEDGSRAADRSEKRFGP